jgi:transposase, IS30 family
MPKGYHHVTRDQRCQITALKSRGISLRQIGKILGLNASTISREIRRNSDLKGYSYNLADKKAKKRRVLASCQPKKLTKKIQDLVIAFLKLGWSPEQISGRFKKEKRAILSYESIYPTFRTRKRFSL